MSRYRFMRVGALGLALVLVAGCGAKHRLAHHDFAGRTLALVHYPAPPPDLITGYQVSGGDDPVTTVVVAGSRLAKELEGRRARARLDSAATRVDLSARMAERTLERASLYLGARPVADRAGADYILEMDLRSVAIDARGDRAVLVLRAETVLLDGRTGREIWSARVRSRGPITPHIDGGGYVPSDVITAAGLSTVSVDDFERLLDGLAILGADWISTELREALRKTRGR